MPVSGKQGCSYVYGIRNNQERCGEGSEAAAEKRKAHRAALTLFMIVNGFTINCNGVQENEMLLPEFVSAPHPQAWRPKRRRKEEV